MEPVLVLLHDRELMYRGQRPLRHWRLFEKTPTVTAAPPVETFLCLVGAEFVVRGEQLQDVLWIESAATPPPV